MEILINDVSLINRKRLVDMGRAKEISESIKEIGLLNPITVDLDNNLIAGAHRVEAYKILGLEKIPFRRVDLSGLKSELAEIDENLIRNELNVLERSNQLLRRKEIYEELYPESKEGISQSISMNKKLGNNVSADSALTFSKDVENKTGRKERTVQEEIQIAKKVIPEVKEAIKNTELSNRKTDLLEISRMEPEEQKKVVNKFIESGAKKLEEVKKEIKKQEFRESVERQKEEIQQSVKADFSGKFDAIAIDPPWPYGTKYNPDGRRVANPYPEMSIEEITNIDLPDKDDCILFLWTTHRFMKDAFGIMDSWGYAYKGIITWDKEKIGMGNWLRMQCEFCLVGIKGKPFWGSNSIRDIIREPRREHSRKPEAFYELVNEVCPGKKLEYFSRTKREGWEVFGNDVERFEAYELAGKSGS